MNFLRHPIYTLFGLGMCGWLSVANARGYNPAMALNPSSWFGSSGGGAHSGIHHGMSHFSGGLHHK